LRRPAKRSIPDSPGGVSSQGTLWQYNGVIMSFRGSWGAELGGTQWVKGMKAWNSTVTAAWWQTVGKRGLTQRITGVESSRRQADGFWRRLEGFGVEHSSALVEA